MKPVHWKAVMAVVLFGVAIAMTVRQCRPEAGSDRAFFFDLSRKELFAGPRTAVPPIQGIDGPEEDAVRAMVVSPLGTPQDRSSWRIAYLEKYSPVLKQQMEEAQASGASPAMGREAALEHRFVKRPEDEEWVPMSSAEAEQLVSEWTAWGTGDGPPVVCSP